MINSVNTVPISYNTGLTANTPMQNPQVNVPVQNYNVDLNGINALASYNQPIANTASAKNIQPALPTILQPEAIKAIQGERIYSPLANLDSIVKKDDKITTVYQMDVQAPNDAIRRIECYDNITGKLIRVQDNFNTIEKGKLPKTDFIEIKDINPENGKTSKLTIYTNGKLDCVKEYEYAPNYSKEFTVTDLSKTITENFNDGKLIRTTSFNKNNQVDFVKTINTDDRSSQTTYYKNGIPVRMSNEIQTPIPNTTGKNPLADADLVPQQPYILGYDPKQVQGEKRNYSNGALHSITTTLPNGGEIIHMFDIKGNLTGIEDASNPANVKDIIYHNVFDTEASYYTVDEQIADNVTKTTAFNKDGSREVNIMDFKNNAEKHAFYSKEGNLSMYFEVDTKGNNLLMEFDKQGNLINLE
ncbi:hypothetical protein IJ541_10060 [bacterium]|nr:hypothetical protein [bacterium]